MSGALIARIFAEASNTLRATATGFTCGHEPVHASKSGTCVRIDGDKGLWYCASCTVGGDAVKAVESLRGLSHEAARAYVRSLAPDTDDEQKKHESQATRLIALALKANVELWHDPDGEPWGTFPVDGHFEHAPLKNKLFRRFLKRLYYEAYQDAPGAQGLQDGLGVLEAKAVYDGPQHDVSVRVAEVGGRLYLDLSDAEWRAVEIDSTGWRIVTNPPARFQRMKGMRPMPPPVVGGSLEELKPFINVEGDDWVLLKAWLLGALSPQGPYPILALHGEQGSAKSSAARLLRAILDPNTVPLRKVPKEEKDLIVAASSSWLQVLDNLSYIQTWLSDALCRLATGGGLADRELYSDGEVFLLDVMRPVILTGIADLATRSDLLDRTIPLVLETIVEENRIQEKLLWAKFETVRPRVLGGLLDALSAALKNRPSTKLPRLPRMADFAVLVAAGAEKLGFTAEQFLDAYNRKRAELHASTLESNLVAQLLIRLVADAPFTGTALLLLTTITSLADEPEKKSKSFPANARSMSNAVRRIAPNLRHEGYIVEFSREGKNRARTLHLEYKGNFASAASAASASAKNKDFFDDLADDRRTQNPQADAKPSGERAAAADTSTNGGRKADAKPSRRTQADANDFPLSSAINTRDNEDLEPENGLADEADANFPTYSSRHPTEDFDWATGATIEVGQEHDIAFDYVTTAAQLEAVLPELLAAPVVALDTETTGLDSLKDRIRLVQMATPTRNVIVDVFTCPLPMLAPVFAQPRQILGHNLKFDLRFLLAAGMPWPSGTLFDTMIAAQLLGASGERPAKGYYSLAEVAQRCIGVTLDKTEQVSNWAGALTHHQLGYAAKDAAVLRPLADGLHVELACTNLTRIAAIEHRCLLALAWMERAGLPIDRERWHARAAEERHRFQALGAQMSAMIGQPHTNGAGLQLNAEPHINWNSPEQVLDVFHARGHALDNTTSERLTALIGTEPLAELLLNYREAKVRASTFGEQWLKQHLHPVTGRVHADYFQLGSTAGRMSCTHPNVQNLPRGGDYRRSVCPGEGRAIVKADFSQIELRIAAVMAGETNMLAAFRQGEDLHRVTASKVLGIPLDQVGKEHRQMAKAVNFGLLYGMGARGLSVYAANTYKVRLTESQAKTHRARFFQAYPGLARWHAQTGACLKEETLMETRTRADRRRADISAFTAALNSPVQGTGADGLKLALARLYEHRDEVPDARLIACVHDEIVAECPQEVAAHTAAWLRHYMIAAMTDIIGDAVPIEVETTIGRDWAGTALPHEATAHEARPARST